MQTETQTKLAMDRMYRWTRHIYDASRKYYLLGRDRLIENLRPEKGETICEIGCGTARNLIKMAQQYPQSSFYGVDVSDEMLKTANAAIQRSGVKNIQIAQAQGESFNPAEVFEKEQFNKIVFSYTLAIIPPWKEALDNALRILKSGGELHIIDFGDQKNLPPAFRSFLFWWLARFHVYHKPDIADYLQQLESEKKGSFQLEGLYRGYAWHMVFKKN